MVLVVILIIQVVLEVQAAAVQAYHQLLELELLVKVITVGMVVLTKSVAVAADRLAGRLVPAAQVAT